MKFIVKGKKRHYPTELWNNLKGPKPDPDFRCDGCSLSPDYYRRFFIWPGCIIHDFHYGGALGRSWAARREADSIFYFNLRQELIDQGAPWHVSRLVPWIYWGRVRIWGAARFPFAENEQPLSWWSRFAEAYGLFRDKRI